jgi:Tfp pilus assembly protein PilP
MKLIKILAIATVLVTAALGQGTPSTAQPKATASPTPVKGTAPATAATTPAAAKTAATKSSPATKAPATTKTPEAAVKTGTAPVTPKPQTPGTTPATAAAKGGTAPATGAAAAGAKKTSATTTRPVATGTKKTAAKPKVAAKTVAAKKAVTKPAKPVKASVVPAVTTTAPERKTPAKLMGAAGRRDPFVSPIRAVSTGTPTGNCTSGKRCLAIPELVLQGTVRDISGKMMAIVVTSNRRTYTLRENDQVFNGSVEKITSDSIIFREFVRDAVGRESAKEVVKKLSPSAS